jgi:hypothetical protein
MFHSDTYKKILEWCKIQYGKSEFQDTFPLLKLEHIPGFKSIYNADNNIIILDNNKVTTIEDAIKCVIHEYIHYTQSKSLFEFLYNEGYEYENHPYELMAEKIAEKDCNKCKNELNLEDK